MVFTPYGIWRTRADELMKQSPIGFIDSLMSLPGDAPVRLYSYQGQEAWDAAEKRGYWTGDISQHEEDGEYGWAPAYTWMRDQMAERIPDFSGDYPMWGWIKRPSTKPKPRRYRGTSDNIRLTVKVPRSRILFSDYDSWHSVLNRSLNCATEAEWDQHSEDFPWHWSMPLDTTEEDKIEYRERYMASIIPTWQRCLAFNPSTDPKVLEWSGSMKYFRVQACVDRFHWNEIVGVRRFNNAAGTP
jgi:hypothetical protein